MSQHQDSDTVVPSQQPPQIHEKKQKLPCIVCGKLYNSKYFLHKHTLLHRLCPAEPSLNPLTNGKCGYCGEEFDNSKIYIEHMPKVAKKVKTESSAPPPPEDENIDPNVTSSTIEHAV
jgi:hypothetical protein